MADVIRKARLEHDPLLLPGRGELRDRLPVSGAITTPPATASQDAHADAGMAITEIDDHRGGQSDLVQRKTQAAEVGYQQGYEAGYGAGHAVGHEDGYESGHKEGYEAGKQEGAARYDEASAELETTHARLQAENAEQSDRLEALLQSLSEQMDGVVANAEDTLVEIAFSAVCKMLGESMVGREGARAAVRSAMAEVQEREQLVLRLAPVDLDWMREEQTFLHAQCQAARLELLADTRIAMGGCVLEYQGGTLDARLETQLQSLREVLCNVRERAP